MSDQTDTTEANLPTQPEQGSGLFSSALLAELERIAEIYNDVRPVVTLSDTVPETAQRRESKLSGAPFVWRTDEPLGYDSSSIRDFYPIGGKFLVVSFSC